VRRVADQIISGGILRAVALEQDLAASPSDVQPVARGHRISIVVHGNPPGTADVENAELTTLGEVFGPHRLQRFEFQRTLSRHRAPEHRAVEICVPQRDGARLEKIGDEKMRAQLFGAERLRVRGVGRVTHGFLVFRF